MRNIKVRIIVDMIETEDPVTSGNDPERMEDGSFKLLTISLIRMFCCKSLIYMIRLFAIRI